MSREIDKLAAEKVMGWIRRPLLSPDYMVWHEEIGEGLVEIMCTEDAWLPSSDISDAKRLTDKVLEQEDIVSYNSYFSKYNGAWRVRFYNNRGLTAGRGQADTEPMARTLAALKVYGIDPNTPD